MCPPLLRRTLLGIIQADAGILSRREMFRMPGRNSAAAPMFCMNPESTPTEMDITPITPDLPVPTFFSTAFENLSIIPVLAIPCPRIITAIIAITALLEKPERVSRAVSTPVHPRASMQRRATTSIRKTSRIRAITVATSMIRTVMTAGSILGGSCVRETAPGTVTGGYSFSMPLPLSIRVGDARGTPRAANPFPVRSGGRFMPWSWRDPVPFEWLNQSDT